MRRRGSGGVEGPRRGRLPVDDDHAVVVIDPPPPDVERILGLVEVEAAEAQGSVGVVVAAEPPDRPGLDRLGRDVGGRGACGALEHLAHPIEALVGVIEVGLLGGKIRMRHRAFQPMKIAQPRYSRPWRRYVRLCRSDRVWISAASGSSGFVATHSSTARQ